MGFFDQGGKAVKFQTPGDTIVGKVISWREAQVTKYGTQEPDFWPDGSAKMQVIIVLETDEIGDDGDDDGVRSLYIASTRQKRALLNALRAGGSKEPDEGGTLTMTFTGNDPKSKNPANPAKLYSASWVAPAVKAQPASTFDAGLGAPAAAARQEAPASTASADKIKGLLSMGLEDGQVAQALGITVAEVQAQRQAA